MRSLCHQLLEVQRSILGGSSLEIALLWEDRTLECSPLSTISSLVERLFTFEDLASYRSPSQDYSLLHYIMKDRNWLGPHQDYTHQNRIGRYHAHTSLPHLNIKSTRHGLGLI